MDFRGLIENIGVLGKTLLKLCEHWPRFFHAISRELTLQQGDAGQTAQRCVGVVQELLPEIAYRRIATPGRRPAERDKCFRHAIVRRRGDNLLQHLARFRILSAMKRLDRIGSALPAH